MFLKENFKKCFLRTASALLFISAITFTGLTSCVPTTGETGFTPNGTTDLPAFSPEGGVYKNKVEVEITSKGQIYYTLDNSVPTAESTKYSGKFTLSETKVVRAMSVVDGKSYYAMTCYEVDASPDYSYTRKPSPNWQDQVIYFLMTDRFFNGNTANDIQDSTNQSILYGDKTDEKYYNGGDFKGIQDKIAYIKNLGATAIWLTPPVKNQWHEGNYNGYHGYWASNFTETDPHYGTMEEYESFVKAAHDAGLYVIQDIVVNHVGDYFKVNDYPINYYTQLKRWGLNPVSLPTTAPIQLPWALNNPNLYTEDEFKNNSFYHWTPPVSDFNDKKQLLTYQMSNLDDMNTDNKVVQNLLRGYFRYWIDKVDIDGYRVDTVKYVSPEFFEDFTNSTESGNKGVREHAKDLGKNDFIVFGEAWDTDESLCASYTKDPVSGTNRMDSSIYFTLAFAIREVFISGESTKKISDVLNQRYTIGYANPDKLVTFIDNHDMPRALQGTSADMLKAAYSIIFTIPGIPQLYYGTEQAFTVARRAMFQGGYKSQGYVNEADMFDENSEWYKYFQSLTKMRADNEIFRKGAVTILEDTNNGPGIFAYKVVQDTGGVGKSAIVLINTSNEDKAIINMPTGFNSGDLFSRLSPYNGTSNASLLVETGGNLTTLLGANSFAVYLLSEVGSTIPIKNNEIFITKIVTDSTTDPVTLITGDTLIIEGTLDSSADIRAFIDGEYNTVVSQSEGTAWSVTLPPLTSLSEGIHTVTALIDTGAPATYIYSNVLEFNYTLKFTEAVSLVDPVGDDTGPEGKAYTLPTDATFIGHHQDITNVKVLTAGSNMQIELTMRDTTKVWSPTKNDFDHVEFSIFIQKAGSTSTTDLNPNHNYTLPNGFVWDYLTMQQGWSAVMYEKTGATITEYGTSITPVPYSEVLHDENKIIFTIKGNMIGKPSSLSGWKIYISTWDSDMGNPRGLETVAAQYKFGGGDGLVDPLVMDETTIISIP